MSWVRLSLFTVMLMRLGAEVTCTDLRGGAALVTAALAAGGETAVSGLQHLDRGYEALDTCLQALGADIRRTED